MFVMNHRQTEEAKKKRDNRSCYAGSLFARERVVCTLHFRYNTFYYRYSVNLIKLGNNAFQMDC